MTMNWGETLDLIDSTTDARLLSRYARRSEKEIRAAVACNTSTSAKALSRLAEDDEVVVRAEVAANPGTPKNALLLLASDGNRAVRDEVAGNFHSPEEAIDRILDDPESDGGTVLIAMGHDYARIYTHPGLWTHQDAAVRIRLCSSSFTSPAELLAYALADTDAGVRKTATAVLIERLRSAGDNPASSNRDDVSASLKVAALMTERLCD